MRHYLPASLLPLLLTTALAADSKPVKPCQIYNPINGNFYDLNAITVQPLKDHKKAHKDDRDESWHARGYDYDKNFTMNFCAPVIEPLDSVVGIEDELVKNVSAFYTHRGETYSIGYVDAESRAIGVLTDHVCSKTSIRRAFVPRTKTCHELHGWLTMR